MCTWAADIAVKWRTQFRRTCEEHSALMDLHLFFFYEFIYKHRTSYRTYQQLNKYQGTQDGELCGEWKRRASPLGSRTLSCSTVDWRHRMGKGGDQNVYFVHGVSSAGLFHVSYSSVSGPLVTVNVLLYGGRCVFITYKFGVFQYHKSMCQFRPSW
jgi:hypothetical protein